jgi:hypothetical protein
LYKLFIIEDLQKRELTIEEEEETGRWYDGGDGYVEALHGNKATLDGLMDRMEKNHNLLTNALAKLRDGELFRLYEDNFFGIKRNIAYKINLLLVEEIERKASIRQLRKVYTSSDEGKGRHVSDMEE